MTTNPFTERYSKLTNSELLEIISRANDYQPLAVETAQKELAKRNVSTGQLSAIKQEIEQGQKVKDDKANEPLGTGLRILTSFFPGLMLIIFSATFTSDGYNRKARELVRWSLYGVAFYFGLAILIFILQNVL